MLMSVPADATSRTNGETPTPLDAAADALGHPVFTGAQPERVMPLLAQVRPECHRTGETVVRPGERPALHLLLSGRLRVFKLTPDGRRVILDYVEPGGMDGPLAVAGRRGHFSEAVTESVTLTLSAPLLQDVVRAEPIVAMNLLVAMSDRLLRREEQLERLCVRHPGQRLAAQLLALAVPSPADLWTGPRLSHEALADMLGLRRETVTLHLGRLRRIGAVRVERDRFVVDPGLLAAVRDGQEPAARIA